MLTSKYFYFLILFFFLQTGLFAQKDLTGLKKVIETDIQKIDGTVAIAFTDLSNGATLLIRPDLPFHAASTMKTPVMIELFKQQAQGKLNLNDSILVKNRFKSIVDGSSYEMDIQDDSGDRLYDYIGKKVTIAHLLNDMITVSSNLATNILIELLDAKKVTQTMRDLGAENIRVLRGVEDIKAYDLDMNNTTTARDLMIILKAIATNRTGSKADCEQMIEILLKQQFNDMIPKYLPKNVKVAHKTGSITGVHHDSAIIVTPDGRKFILVILSKDLKDFDKATDQLAKIAGKIYQYAVNQ